MVAKFNSKNQFIKKRFCCYLSLFHPNSASKLARSAKRTPKYFILQKYNKGIKNAEFDADFKSVEIVAKNDAK